MTPAEARARRLHALELHAGFYGLLNALLIVIWALTSRGYFWPVWTLLALGLPLAIHAWVVLVRELPEVARRQHIPRALAYYEGIALSFSLFFVLVWAVTGHGYFWPVWPILGFAIGLAVQAFVVVVRRMRRGEERIETLETSRAGAVDLQESELRRIERDLHDGAQARLVDVGMSLGLAEQKLRTDPGAAQELLAEARRGAHEALEELRDLARGIHPPMLTDRGLDAAVRSLVDRSPLDVHVNVELDGRPPPAVEATAYFVVAEAVANASKHAGANRLNIGIRRSDGADAVEVEVEDDGHGGADESGRGITGLRQRVQALDGTLAVSSPEGGPTVVRAVLPCVS
jgi:signal transduction histidine kinase